LLLWLIKREKNNTPYNTTVYGHFQKNPTDKFRPLWNPIDCDNVYPVVFYSFFRLPLFQIHSEGYVANIPQLFSNLFWVVVGGVSHQKKEMVLIFNTIHLRHYSMYVHRIFR
ncbi:uncharacterized protein METZ01_LOCUS175542, partial [marine metagenome]